jgi:hypothetical protein
MSIDDVFDRMANAKGELAQPDYASDAGTLSPRSRQLVDAQEAGHDQYDSHLASGSFIRHDDSRPFEDKAAYVPHGGNGGDGSGWPGPGQPPPWWPPTKGGGGGSGGGGSGSGGSGSGGSGNGSGPPGWFKKWWQQQRQRGGMQRGGSGGARGIGGGQLAGPGSLGNIPKLGDVPIAPAGTTSTGPSPIVLMIVLGGAGIGGYLLYHKLKLAKHQNAELAKGKDPTPDAAT